MTVDDNHDGQRLDNFLARLCRGVPRSHVYQLIRSGQVRVNGGRASADRKLATGDRVRIPPVRGDKTLLSGAPIDPGRVGTGLAGGPVLPVLFENDDLLVLDKPAGLAVHGGSGVSLGAIEALRRQRPDARFLELAHRLDRETSGVLLIAKRRPALLHLQQQFRDRRTDKTYLAVVCGRWPLRTKVIDSPLKRLAAPDGDRRVEVDASGREARTTVRGLFRLPMREDGEFTLVLAKIDTGRTHQIRVHLASEGCPVLGDDKYGDFALNRSMAKKGFKRMFLHAWSLEVGSLGGGRRMQFEAEPGGAFGALIVAGGGPLLNREALATMLGGRSGSALTPAAEAS